jgi:hypothetical protein
VLNYKFNEWLFFIFQLSIGKINRTAALYYFKRGLVEMKIAKFEHRSQERTVLKQKMQIFPGQQ